MSIIDTGHHKTGDSTITFMPASRKSWQRCHFDINIKGGSSYTQ